MVGSQAATIKPLEEVRGLDTVRVSKEFLLEKLKSNRDSHRATFDEAIDGWHVEVLKVLKDQIRRVKANKRHIPDFYLPVPTDHTADYDRVIALLEASLDDEFALSMGDFSKYVMDNWGWKNEFSNTASNYMNQR